MIRIMADTFAKDLAALAIRAQALSAASANPVSTVEPTTTRERYGVYMARVEARRNAAAIKAGHVSHSQVTGTLSDRCIVPRLPKRALTRIQPIFIRDERRALRTPPPPCIRSEYVPRKVYPTVDCTFPMTQDAMAAELAALTITQSLDNDATIPAVASREDTRVGDTYSFMVKDRDYGYIGTAPASRPWLRSVLAQRAWYLPNPVTYRDIPEMGFSGPATVDEEREQQEQREALDILQALADPDLSFSNTPHVGSVESEFAWLLNEVRNIRGSYFEMLTQASAAGFRPAQAKGHAQLTVLQRKADSLVARYNARRCVAALAERRGVQFRAEWDKVMARKAEVNATYTQILQGYVTQIGRLNMAALLDPERGHITVPMLYKLPQPVALGTPLSGISSVEPHRSGPKTLWPAEMVQQYAAA